MVGAAGAAKQVEEEAMIGRDLLDRLRAIESGAPLDLPAIRADIHAAFKQAATAEERGALLAIHKAVMDSAERQISSADIDAFKKARTEDYNLLLITEALVGDLVSPELLEAVTRREVEAGRMSPTNDLRQLAAAGKAILVPTPRTPSPWARLWAWIRRPFAQQ